LLSHRAGIVECQGRARVCSAATGSIAVLPAWRNAACRNVEWVWVGAAGNLGINEQQLKKRRPESTMAESEVWRTENFIKQ